MYDLAKIIINQLVIFFIVDKKLVAAVLSYSMNLIFSIFLFILFYFRIIYSRFSNILLQEKNKDFLFGIMLLPVCLTTFFLKIFFFFFASEIFILGVWNGQWCITKTISKHIYYFLFSVFIINKVHFFELNIHFSC